MRARCFHDCSSPIIGPGEPAHGSCAENLAYGIMLLGAGQCLITNSPFVGSLHYRILAVANAIHHYGLAVCKIGGGHEA